MSASDVDAIDTLSLSIIPLNSSTLKGAKLIKNSRLETAVELHNDPISGSLQLQPEDIGDAFAGSEDDQAIIMALSALHSYDVFSMRSSLRKLGVHVEDSMLNLSPQMKSSLAKYSSEFTRPLVEKIFGDASAIDVSEGGDSIQRLLRDADTERVKKNLTTITARTGIPMTEIPEFLEKYSDVYLSVAYYRYSFETIGKDIDRFQLWIAELQKHRDIASSAKSISSCKKVDAALKFISQSIKERLVKFNDSFELFWKDINKESFDELRRHIENNHTSMGAVLCGLMVKMGHWSKEFPDNDVGGPQKRAKFVVADMEPGLERLKKMEADARKETGIE